MAMAPRSSALRSAVKVIVIGPFVVLGGLLLLVLGFGALAIAARVILVLLS